MHVSLLLLVVGAHALACLQVLTQPLPCLLQGATCDAHVEDSKAVPGSGLTAVVDGHRVAAGTAGLLASAAGVAGPEVEAAQKAIDAEGGPRRGDD